MAYSIWSQSNGGETTTFWSCKICGASVQQLDRTTHEMWHKRLERRCVRAPGAPDSKSQ
jgi:hypothetical protein